MLTLLFVYILYTVFKSGVRLQSTCLPNGEYITRERTCMINGIFIWLVFSSHMTGYNWTMPYIDRVFYKIAVWPLGQCVVATFFFFSGFGIMSSLKKKGRNYAISLTTKRFSLLLLHFSIAVSIFTILQAFLGTTYSAKHIALSLIGWFSVGNSNWFIFITLVGYLFISISYFLFHKAGTTVIAAACAGMFLILIPFLSFKGSYWVDSCLCIPAGMLFCEHRKTCENILHKLKAPVWLSGIVTTILGMAIYIYMPADFFYFWKNTGTIIFALGICFLFSCITITKTPRFLCWSGGAALFFLYIFQRIPMRIGSYWALNKEYPYLYELFCIGLTIFIAWLSTIIFNRLDKLCVNIIRKSKD